MPNPYSSKSKAEYKSNNASMEVTSAAVTRGLDEVQTTNEVMPHLDHYTSVPQGNIDGVLTWVGDDADKAQAALEVEQNSEKPRKTLIERLKELING